MRKAFDTASGQFCGQILDAGNRVGVRAFAVEQFSQDA
jgi:hypothetical protein